MFSCLRNGLLLAAVMLSTACTKVGLFVANVPAGFGSTKIFENVVFDEEHDLKLDIFVPDGLKAPAPVIVFYYGGRWTDGDKAQYHFVADSFVNDGYIVVIPNYRKYPKVKFPAFARDTAKALAWVYENAQDYNADQGNIFVAGHSSGAHLAALVATNPEYLKAYDLDRSIIRGFAGLSGPYAFEPEAEDLKDMFGPPERYPLMRAPNFVDGQQPPMLLIHGLDDTTVVLKNAEELRDAVQEKGGEVALVTYKDIDHVETVGSLMWFWRYKSDIRSEMLGFFEKQQGRFDEQ